MIFKYYDLHSAGNSNHWRSRSVPKNIDGLPDLLLHRAGTHHVRIYFRLHEPSIRLPRTRTKPFRIASLSNHRYMHHQYSPLHSDNPYTATIHANLYCDRSTERNLIQSAIYIGAIIGLLGLTPFADSKGKKKMFLIAIALCIIGIFSINELIQWTLWESMQDRLLPL